MGDRGDGGGGAVNLDVNVNLDLDVNFNLNLDVNFDLNLDVDSLTYGLQKTLIFF